MKLKNNGKIIFKKIIIPVFSVLIIIFSWQLASIKINSPLILPSFFKVCKAFFYLIQTKIFYIQLAKTFLRVFFAFCLSIFAGIIFGFFCGKFQDVKKIFSFPLAVLRVTPVVAIILILVFSLSSSAVPVVASVLMTLPVVITTITEGVDSFFKNSRMNEMTRIFGFTRKQKIFYVLIPTLKPYLKSSVFSSFGMSWKVVVAGEVLCHPKYALGSALADAQIHLETSTVMAYTLALILINFIFEVILKYLCSEKKYSEEDTRPNPEKFIPQISENEKVALIAPSGFGKTTLLDYLSKTYNDVSYCFQENRLIGDCSVFQNIVIPLLNKYEKITAEKQADYFIQNLALEEKKNVKVKFLSGGQKQRVALARALAFPSRILLLDESFNSLDYDLKKSIMNFIKAELQKSPKTLIFVTHDEEEGKYLCDKVIKLTISKT